MSALNARITDLADDLRVLHRHQAFRSQNRRTRQAFDRLPDLARVRVALVGQNALTEPGTSREDSQSIDVMVEIEGSTRPLEDAMHLIRHKYIPDLCGEIPVAATSSYRGCQGTNEPEIREEFSQVRNLAVATSLASPSTTSTITPSGSLRLHRSHYHQLKEEREWC
ncbi:uncharacterized protein KD926_009707 [Aspergillus affinis]|uniref:uncharacterized protein n=1 Tax=Aspergillus affinis TaxID=1070780 RepID=UPI0022FDC4F8|nr:uncharacterized protein KD926_009707 [Aspergillus affinis]KAI9045293.1 hypothetical protein KD926_009707 [Aspergillus affinis]